jgi:hypothetical protein
MYNWKLMQVADNGRTLWRDLGSPYLAICEVGEFPDDADAFVFGVTPDTWALAERWWREACLAT